MLKKFMAGLLAATMALSMNVISYAETLDISCELSSDSVEVGDIFYADFKINSNPTGYNSMQCFIDFDPAVVEAVDSEVADIPDDLILYTDSKGVNYAIFSYTNVNGRINFVPKKGDRDYLGMADGTTRAGKLGRVKLANLLNISIDGVPQNYTGTGTVLRMKFRAIAPGSTEITMSDVVGGYVDENGNYELDYTVNNASVTVNGEPADVPDESTSESTTVETPAETTTTGSGNNNSSGGGSGGSSGGNSGSKTTTEATTVIEMPEEPTTMAPVIGGGDNKTDITVAAFSDVPQSFWAYSYITDLASKKIINGYPDGTFKPQNNVTRADFLIMLLRALDVDTSNAAEGGFTDVEAGAYYAAACNTAKALGIASGNPDGTFNPKGYITRQDMMVLTKKALETVLKDKAEFETDLSVLDKFADKAEISAYAQESLAAMVNAGVVNGMGDGIAPKANTTRAQAATIIAKALELK